MHKAVQDLASRLPALEPKLGDWNTNAVLQSSRPVVALKKELFIGDEAWKEKVRNSLSHHFGPKAKRLDSKPMVTAHAIASGNMLVKDPALLKDWFSHARDLKAVEMELPGIYEAARGDLGDRPVLAIRGISDIVGYKRNPMWTAYACRTAASLAKALLRTGPIEPSSSSLDPVVLAGVSSISIPVAAPTSSPKMISNINFAVCWLLPRGFLILSDLTDEGPSWGVVADYYDYEGAWRGATHFHESYDWKASNDFRVQSVKLQIQAGDQYLAEEPLRFLMEIRKGHLRISHDGVLTQRGGNAFKLPKDALLLPPGEVSIPRPTPTLQVLGRLGALRDKSSEAHILLEDKSASDGQWLADAESLRRTMRIEFAKAFPNQQHPVRINATEFLANALSNDTAQVSRWLRGAISLIEESIDAALNDGGGAKFSH